MAVERAPYLDYTEITSYYEDINNGSEIPLFVVKTGNSVALSDISPASVLKFVSYDRFKDRFSISNDETEYASLPESVKSLDSILKGFFVENSLYGENDNYGLSVPYVYVIDVGNAPTIDHYVKALSVSEMKRKSTVVVFPHTEDVEFMKAVDIKLKQETKHGFLRIAYFAVSGQGELTHKFAKGDVLIPSTNADSYSEVIEVYKDTSDGKFYANKEGNTFSNEITPKATAIYLNKANTQTNKDAYVYVTEEYTPITVTRKDNALLYETDANYKFIIPSTKQETGGSTESFDNYLNRLSFISQAVNSSRVAIVDRNEFGKTIARICSTPYYVEPGYLPYMSVQTGVFKEISEDNRDSLFATGLIFGEDDYRLSITTPRICVATSTAWGVEDHDMRTTDSLLHARRNVDYHVRRILKIIAPQLKRNETGVTLRYVQNQVDLYLDSELTKGTIMEYSVKVIESSYNPYKLLVKGRIVPVNSTLGIEFENTIGSPYAIASNYV